VVPCFNQLARLVQEKPLLARVAIVTRGLLNLGSLRFRVCGFVFAWFRGKATMKRRTTEPFLSNQLLSIFLTSPKCGSSGCDEALQMHPTYHS
jgi:hypothetical protein